MDKKASAKRAKIVEAAERKLRALSDRAGRELAAYVLDNTPNWLALETVDGVLRVANSQANLQAANAQNFVTNYFAQNIQPQFQTLFDTTFEQLNTSTASYYNIRDLTQQAVRNKVEAAMQASLGRNAALFGGGSSAGWYNTLFNIQAVEQQARTAALNAIATGQNYSEFARSMRGALSGTANSLGAVARHFYTFAFDAFAEYDREINNQYAAELSLNYAIYQGGEIKTTRPFCEARNGEVWTREEILSWQNLNWSGKKNPHNILIDCGGYNCRHYYDWISYELAVQLRPDIPRSRFDNQETPAT